MTTAKDFVKWAPIYHAEQQVKRGETFQEEYNGWMINIVLEGGDYSFGVCDLVDNNILEYGDGFVSFAACLEAAKAACDLDDDQGLEPGDSHYYR